MRPGPIALLVASALAAVAAARAATAQDQSGGVAIVAGRRGALAARLADELRAAGLTARVEAAPGDVSHDGLVMLLGDGDDPAIEIFMRRGDKIEPVAVIPGEGALDARVLRATEVARALVLPAGTPGAPPNAEPPRAPTLPTAPTTPAASTAPPMGGARPIAPIPITPPVRPLIPAPVPSVFEAGAAAALGVAAQGPSMAIDASVRVWPHERVGVGVLASLPVVGTSIESTEGDATMRTFLFGAELPLAPLPRAGSFGLVLAPGLGVGYLALSAEAGDGYRAGDEGAFAGVAYARAEGRLRITDSVQATAGVLGGGAFPPVEIQFAGRPITTFTFTGDVSLGILAEL